MNLYLVLDTAWFKESSLNPVITYKIVWQGAKPKGPGAYITGAGYQPPLTKSLT